MLTGDLRNQIDRLWDSFWSGGISNPLEVIEQITYLLFLRRLDELQQLEENKANRLGTPVERRLFPEGKDSKGRGYEDLRWSRFKHMAPAEMYEVVSEHVFPFLRTLGGNSGYARHMKDARFTIPTPALLAKVVDMVDKVPMEDRDTKGDLYEYMLGKIASAGQNVTPIIDVARIASGGTPSTSNSAFWNGDIAWVTPKDLSDLDGKKLLDTTPRSLTAAGLRACSAEVLPPNSVLFSSRAPIGLVAINTIPVATNQGFKSFVPDPQRLDSNYLYHWLRKNRLVLERLGVGATFKEVSKAIVSRLQIPLPPVREQRLIAATLDKAEEIRAKRRAALNLLDRLPEAIFLEMFGDLRSNEKGWLDTLRLADVAELVSGITKGRKVNGKAVREVPFMAVLNVQDKRLNLETIKTIEATAEEITRFRLRAGDLLLTEGGDPDKLGRGTLWSNELPEAVHQNHVFRVRITSVEITPLYLSWLVGSVYGKSYFLRKAKQTTGIATINMAQLKAFPLVIPPVSLQHDFGARVGAINRAKAAHLSSLAELDALCASLQHHAFDSQGDTKVDQGQTDG